MYNTIKKYAVTAGSHLFLHVVPGPRECLVENFFPLIARR